MMSTGRHIAIGKLDYPNNGNKINEGRGIRLAKLKIKEVFSTRRMTNFTTAEEFF